MMVLITMTTKMTSAPEREGCTNVVHHEGTDDEDDEDFEDQVET